MLSSVNSSPISAVCIYPRSPPTEEEQTQDVAYVAGSNAENTPYTYKFIRTLNDRDEESYRTSIRLYAAVDENEQPYNRFVVKLLSSRDEDAILNQQRVCEIVDTLPESDVLLKNRRWTVSQRNEILNPEGRSKVITIIRHELRSYTDFCAHGTLDDVIRNYGSAQWQRKSDDQISEAFLWVVTKAISEAIYNLHTGLNFVDGSAEQALNEDWDIVVHRDIKPENILLKEPVDPYTSFPTPVLADLDGLIELDKDAEFEGKYEVSSYPQGYAAPASLPEHNPELSNNHSNETDAGIFSELPLSSKTDIWSLGAVLWDMMHSYLGRAPLNQIRESGAHHIFDPDPSLRRFGLSTLPLLGGTGNEPTFTRDMIAIFDMCNQTYPDRRPDPGALRALVEEKMARAQKVLGSFEGEVEERMRLRYNQDEFRMDKRWVFPGDEDEDDEENEDEHEIIGRSRKRRRIEELGQDTGNAKCRR